MALLDSSGGRATCGGIVRDSSGNWLCGIARFVGFCTLLEAELWGILEGLRLCWDRGCRYINCQVDSDVAVSVIKVDQVGRLAGCGLVRKIRKLLALNWDVRIDHVSREANQCVESLATYGCNQSEFLIVFEQNPSSMKALVVADCMSVTVPPCCISS